MSTISSVARLIGGLHLAFVNNVDFVYLKKDTRNFSNSDFYKNGNVGQTFCPHQQSLDKKGNVDALNFFAVIRELSLTSS